MRQSFFTSKLFLCQVNLEVNFFQCVAVRPSYWYLSFLSSTLNPRLVRRESGRNLLTQDAAKLFLCTLKLEVNFFLCVAVRPIYWHYAEHKARNEPHHPGRVKALSVRFKVGSELLPVRSGTGLFELDALTVLG
jgi:hypothetical protein